MGNRSALGPSAGSNRAHAGGRGAGLTGETAGPRPTDRRERRTARSRVAPSAGWRAGVQSAGAPRQPARRPEISTAGALELLAAEGLLLGRRTAAAGLPGHWAAGLPRRGGRPSVPQASGLRVGAGSGLQIRSSAGSGSELMGVGCQAAGLPGCRAAGLPGARWGQRSRGPPYLCRAASVQARSPGGVAPGREGAAVAGDVAAAGGVPCGSGRGNATAPRGAPATEPAKAWERWARLRGLVPWCGCSWWRGQPRGARCGLGPPRPYRVRRGTRRGTRVGRMRAAEPSAPTRRGGEPSTPRGLGRGVRGRGGDWW